MNEWNGLFVHCLLHWKLKFSNYGVIGYEFSAQWTHPFHLISFINSTIHPFLLSSINNQKAKLTKWRNENIPEWSSAAAEGWSPAITNNKSKEEGSTPSIHFNQPTTNQFRPKQRLELILVELVARLFFNWMEANPCCPIEQEERRKKNKPTLPFQQFSSFLMAHSGPTKRRVAEWACRAAGPLGEPFHSFSCMPLIDCLLLSATTNQLTYFASFISLIVFSGPPINLFHFFQSIHLLIRELMKKWEIVGPLYSNRPTSTNQKLFNNFIVLIY